MTKLPASNLEKSKLPVIKEMMNGKLITLEQNSQIVMSNKHIDYPEHY